MGKDILQAEAVVIVQARMGSGRLPGKMMMDLAGRPLLWHILQRARMIDPGLPVVLAIPDTPADGVLVPVAVDCGAAVLAGPHEDVLGRFMQVLADYPARWVVRICGDSPLFGVEHLRRCLELARSHQADVVKFPHDPGTLLQGGEVVSHKALEFSRATAPQDPLAREHVTAWALRHAVEYPDQLRVVTVEPDPRLVLDRKLSIDTLEDLERLRVLYRQLWDGGAPLDLLAVASWLQGAEGQGWPGVRERHG